MKACGIVKIWSEINVQLFGFDKLSAVVSLMCKFSDLNQLILSEMESYVDFFATVIVIMVN